MNRQRLLSGVSEGMQATDGSSFKVQALGKGEQFSKDDQPQKKDYISQLHCSWEITGRAASQPMIQIPGHHCLLGHCSQVTGPIKGSATEEQ